MIEEILNKKKYLRNIIKEKSYVYTFSFIFRNGYEIPLKMYINKKRFPFELPLVFIDLDKQSYIPAIPHITSSGYICYLDEEGVAWSDNIEKIFDFIFKRIESVFLQQESKEGIHREFQYYFSQVPDKERIFSFISQGKVTRKIKAFVFKEKNLKFICDTSKLEEDNIGDGQIVNALYIPFNKELDLYIPNKQKFWTGSEIECLVKRCVSKDNLKKINDLTKNCKKMIYILDILLAGGENVLVGIKYEGKINKGESPILKYANEYKITPIYIERIDDKKILTRGGAITTGDQYNILVIGCGSVGSDTIFQLARSGFKKFTLVDNDSFSQDNVYRHFLGKSIEEKDRSKVVLMKKELESRYRDIECISLNSDIFTLLEEKEIDLSDYDLVISAIGNVNKERLLNKYILKTKVPVIYTWVEAYGIGGHAVFINKHGCYNCLFTEDLRCKVNFAGKSEVPFTKNFGGCLGTFTPYGGMDSMQTSIMTARLAQDYLINNRLENAIVSWRGNADRFLNDGYTLSESYYDFYLGIGERHDVKLEGCAYCNDTN
ncbi:ThiF family adenylyltransferase [Romboutsia sp. 1001216sp1]|uniref:ThiF family adenylyltransferase n=1 Tax=Romboutsia sp. 1001216sp1 TaxID=2986997 RepID=UPI00232D1225|nr:ThiF family adenylyltransferase [Romboutsia sp. 1001216sp1]MDB8803649.1 ThiF family adenylyltransferase [Romboutsia sp. 1001216sp1]MDB8807849.1 ThiF family adenylyltransferase [Romboutsia sp. 1001216sp1]MDB8809296.1 ThiF family adenylyltransferase [Romboutsia sp. 1001216sp1]MDB8815045.1 ThiF family adenylyltransferase [Romboutsia sp. 1001216sp1]MDB8817738.1 ThiF family adenylyltransferase [Romboutsia sp. 1001216sp1]